MSLPPRGSTQALTLPEAAAAVGLSTSTLRRHIRRGRLHASRVRGKFGEEYRITPAALAALGLPVRLPPRGAGRTPPELGELDVRRALAHLAREIAALRHELGRLRSEVRILSSRISRLQPRRGSSSTD